MADKKAKKAQVSSKFSKVVDTVLSLYLLVFVARAAVAVGRAVVKRYVGA